MTDHRPRRRRWRVWLLAIAGAVVVAGLLRVFVAEAFRIPTGSMEPTVAAGDFVLVSKLHYGARTPERPRIPLTEWRVPGLRLPSLRLPGFRSVRRGDVIVFYHPAEPGEVFERTPYVKRVAGLPGDSVRIVGKNVRVNGRDAEIDGRVQTHWLVTWRERAQPEQAAAVGAEPIERAGLRAWRVRASAEVAAALQELPEVESAEPAEGRPDGALFPPGTDYTPDDYGPVMVPGRGDTIRVTDASWPAVRATLEREGRHANRIAAGSYEIDGEVTDTVVFEQDYFFVLGDNRDDSADSRRWGFVPRDHLIGKAVLVYFSWDEEAGRPRLGRILRGVR